MITAAFPRSGNVIDEPSNCEPRRRGAVLLTAGSVPDRAGSCGNAVPVTVTLATLVSPSGTRVVAGAFVVLDVLDELLLEELGGAVELDDAAWGPGSGAGRVAATAMAITAIASKPAPPRIQ